MFDRFDENETTRCVCGEEMDGDVYTFDGEAICLGCFEEAVHFACIAAVAAASETTRQEAIAGGVA
tara:strand:+ start:3723 stop:3920 length:198 start_codon:yes stop_codon:yes gene_type:complete